MINKIKEEISNCKNYNLIIKINNIRNKSEFVEGVLIEVYDRVFVMKCIDGIKRSFTYVDILTGNIEIQDKIC